MATPFGQQEIITFAVSFPCSAAITKGDVVKHSIDASGTVAQCSAITDDAIGCALQGTTNAGDTCAVQMGGIAIMTAQGSITEGDQLMPSATAGRVQTAAGATSKSIGLALQTAASGEKVAVFLGTPPLRGPANP